MPGTAVLADSLGLHPARPTPDHQYSIGFSFPVGDAEFDCKDLYGLRDVLGGVRPYVRGLFVNVDQFGLRALPSDRYCSKAVSAARLNFSAAATLGLIMPSSAGFGAKP